MSYIIYIFFGLAPSIIWLLFYLRKDVHPESNKMILKIFLYGMFGAIIAALVELAFSETFQTLTTNFLLYHFLIIALVEELSKYLIVKVKVINHPEFDEPVDVMLYMIIVALGFAALENILVLFSGESSFVFQEVFRKSIVISSVRFIGATFLHALSSGALGYFLALSFFETKKRLKLTLLGIAIATLLHGFFNISIIGIEGSLSIKDGQLTVINFPLFIFSLISVIITLSFLGFFISFSFKKLKKIASICKTP